jgi:hypothetical protein
MSTVQGGDEFLVNRSGGTYRQSQSQLMAKLETNDQLLVNRNGGTYRVSGGDFINSVIDPLVFSVTLQPGSPIIGQTVTAVAVAQGGKAPAGGWVFTYQWIIADDDSGTNASDLAGETSSTYTPTNPLKDKYLGCRSTTVDYKGTSYTATDYAGPITSAQIAPQISSVNLSETFDGVNRYTDKDFPFTTAMSIEGEPDPEYSLKVKLSGSTFNFDIESDVINAVEGGGTYDGSAYDNKVTLDSDIYLTNLTNKSVKMVDDAGDSTYTLTCSSITNVDPANSWVQDDYLSDVTGNADPSYPTLRAFDGNINSTNLSQLGTYITFNFSSIPCKTLRLRTYSGSLSSATYSLLKVNDVEEQSKVPGTDGYHWVTIWENEENKTLDKIESSMETGSVYLGIAAIEVDGQILVDNTATGTDPQTNQKLTFADPCTDLQYFQKGDQVGSVYQNVFFTSDATGTFAGLSGIDPSLTTAQSITNSPGSGYCVVDLINGTTDAKITSSITGFMYAYSVDGTSWSSLASLNSGSTYTDLSIRGVLVSDHGQAVADTVRYFLWGGLTDWSVVTIQLEQSLVDATRMGGYTPNSNLQSGGGEIIAINTTDRTMTVNGGSYDTSNQSEQWSSFMTSTDPSGTGYFSTSDPIYAFNGVLSNSASTTSANSGDLVITFPNGKRPTVTNKVEVYTNASNAASATLVTNNGTSATVDFDVNTGWTEIQEAGKLGDIETITISKSATLAAVRVDGQILVDPAITADFSSAGETSGSQTANAFDGNISTQPYATSGTTSTYTFADPIKITQSLRMWIVVSLNNGGFAVNGTFPSSANLPNSSNGQGRWYNFTNHVGVGNNLESITWAFTAGNRFTAPGAIEVDGKLLLDSALRDYGVNTITLPTSGGLGTLVKSDAEDAYIENTGNSLNRWIGPNQANKDFKIVPVTPIQESTTTAWGVVEQTGGTIEVKSVVGDEPEFELLTSKDGTIEFPATFTSTGNAPDTDLPVGTAIQAVIKASNTAGDDEATSSPALIPADPNPAGSVGPITASTETTITSDNTANINELTASDKLMMVDNTGAKATYALETSTITEAVTTNTTMTVAQGAGKAWANQGAHNLFSAGAKTAFEGTADGNDTTSITYLRCYPAASSDTEYVITGCPTFNDDDDIGIYFRKYTTGSFSSPFIVDGVDIGPGANDEVDGNGSGTRKGRPWAFKGSDFPNNTIGTLKYVEPGTSGSTQFGLTVITVNGVPLTDYARVELTFAGTAADDNKDLKFFRPGDGLQGLDQLEWSDYVTGSPYSAAYNAVNGFDGDSNTRCGGSFKFEPPTPIKCEKVKVWQTVGASSYTGVKLNGVQIPDPVQTGSGLYNNANEYDVTEFVSWECVNNGDEPGWWNKIELLINGEWVALIDRSVGGPGNYAQVISVGTSASPPTNTMIVDGGTWDTSNQSQLWSDYKVTERADRPWTDAFDGVTNSTYNTNEAASNSNTTEVVWIYTGSEQLAFSKIEVWACKDSGSGANSVLKINDVDVSSQLTANTYDWYELTGVTGPLTSIKMSGYATPTQGVMRLGAVKLDGRILIDKLYDDEVWSSTTFSTAGAAGNGAYSSDRAFSGEVGGEQVWYPPIGATAVFETGTKFDSSSTIEFKYTRSGTADFSLNGAALNLPVGIDQTYTASLSSGFQKLEWTYSSGANYCALAWIKLDGILLQDKGIRNFGATKVTFTPPSGTATFNTAVDEVLTVTGSNDRWISNDNRLGIDFYVKKDLGRGLDANNPADVQIYQDIVDAFAAFPVKVNQRRTSIASTLFRLINGDGVSAAEAEILEDVVLDAVNAQEPLALDGYYPLYYTADAADAASATGTHHVHTIDGTEYYMPDGGTIYHGNYIS